METPLETLTATDPDLRAALARHLASVCAGSSVDAVAVRLAALLTDPHHSREALEEAARAAGRAVEMRGYGHGGHWPTIGGRECSEGYALEAMRQLARCALEGRAFGEPWFVACAVMECGSELEDRVLAAAGVPDALHETVLALLRDGMPYRDALTAARLLVPATS